MTLGLLAGVVGDRKDQDKDENSLIESLEMPESETRGQEAHKKLFSGYGFLQPGDAGGLVLFGSREVIYVIISSKERGE